MEDARFVEDIFLRNMLYAVTIRSPVAKGRLLSIECPELGGCLLITAKDIPGKNFLSDTKMPLLADRELSYIGEPVALLLGPNRNELEVLAADCKVIAEEEEAFFSANKAEEEKSGFVFAKRDICIGNPEEAFSQAESVVRGSYHTGIQEHWYAEPTGAVAWPSLIKSEAEEEAGSKRRRKTEKTVVVRTATQWPNHVRRSVAAALGLSVSSVAVKPTEAGFHADGKFWYPSFVSCHAALGAWVSGSPVKLTLTRLEDFSFSPKRCESEIEIESAVDKKGTITGIKINARIYPGAYGMNAAEILDQYCLGSLGGYNIKNILYSGSAVETNIPPQGPFAGFGMAQGFFAIERHVSHVADKCGQDPAEWRLANCSKNGIFLQNFSEKNFLPQGTLIERAVKMSDYYRKWAACELLRQKRSQIRHHKKGRSPHESSAASWSEKNEVLRGIGIATGYQSCGLLYPGAEAEEAAGKGAASSRGGCGVEIVLEKEGALEIRTNMTSDGYIWKRIAREILGVNEEKIKINNDPSLPDSGPSISSRSVTVVAKLVEQACLSVQKRRFRDPLPITVRKTARLQKDAAGEKILSPPKGLRGNALQDFSVLARPGRAAAVVEVEIDPVEFIPRIRGIWMSVDGGKIICEERARRKLNVSAIQALGWIYRERISYTNGCIPADQFEGFDIFAAAEMPVINIDFVQNDSASSGGKNGGSNDPKGIGDLPFACIPAAYYQAVSQAADDEFNSIPLRKREMWKAGSGKKA